MNNKSSNRLWSVLDNRATSITSLVTAVIAVLSMVYTLGLKARVDRNQNECILKNTKAIELLLPSSIEQNAKLDLLLNYFDIVHTDRRSRAVQDTAR